MILQLAFVLTAIIIGARLGGIGLGVMGGVGLGILTFVFGLQPTAPPIDVMLMIAAVISAASCMQAAGGLDYMVKLAEHLLRKNPSHVTLLSPLVTYLFTFIAGTGHVAYSVLPVIAEVATETKIRPERPLGIAVIASQQAITASPISAATVALLGLLAGFDITLFDILKITIPATIIGVLVGALFSMKVGKELIEDPEYQKRLKDGLFNDKKIEIKDVRNKRSAMLSVLIFILATAFSVLWFVRQFASCLRDRRRDGETRHVFHYRNRHAVCGSHHPDCHQDGWNQGHARFCIPRRNAGCYRHLRYCLDGRHIPSGQYGTTDSFYRRCCTPDAMAVRYRTVRHVYPVIQSGSHRTGIDAVGHCIGNFSVYADCFIPGSQRIFLYPELPDCSSSH